MTINKKDENKTITLVISGSLDVNTSPQLYSALMPLFGAAKQVILDFAEVDYVSSAGLRVLLQAEKAAKSNDSSMTLRAVTEEVMEVLEITGFSDILNISK